MDIVERLRWSISADTPARYPDIVNDAISEIEAVANGASNLFGRYANGLAPSRRFR